jgi:tetratricopeptide (TPR) repeat protein
MGVVYAATHLESSVQAAVKTVHEVKASRLSQMRREALALTRLKHPGVVRILGHGSDQGRLWYAMEMMEGMTLKGILASDWAHLSRLGAPLPAAGGRLLQRVALIQWVCETLAYVHGEGILHRDIKPGNIFLGPDGMPVLVDFGLAVNVGGMRGREELDGDPVWIAGSVQYMAPEQIRGDLLDARCDLYAVGCLLYALIVGHPPFLGGTAFVAGQHQTAEPVPPSELVLGVPPELDALVLRLLAKDRRDRPAYAEDVAKALGRLGTPPMAWNSPPPGVHPYLYRPPLVGREESLARLQAGLDRAGQGRGGLVFISGASGVGKTRLAMEVARGAHAHGLRVTTGGCVAIQAEASARRVKGAPLHPWLPVLRAISDWCVERGPEAIDQVFGHRLPVLAAYEPELREIPGFGELPEPLPLAADAARSRLFRYLEETLGAYLAEVPTLLVLDDLQWADELTLGVLEHLRQGPLPALPLLILGTYRREECSGTLAALACADGVLDVTLNRLSEGHVGALVGGMLTWENPPGAFIRFLSERSDGNPFFLAEYLRMAVTMRVLVRNPDGQWSFAESGDPTEVLCESLPLPKSLHLIIATRIRGLGADARRVLACATAVGREFDAEIVQVAEQLDDEAMLEALDELVGRQVVESMGSLGHFRFSHDKLREIPYGQLGDGVAAEIHERVAAAMEARYEGSTRIGEHEGALGHHWSKAGHPRQAQVHFLKAGDRAEKAGAINQAVFFYRRALAELEALGPAEDVADAEAALNEKLGDLLTLSGLHGEARTAFESGIRLLDGREALGRARLHRKIGKVWELEHEHGRSLDAYARAEQSLEAAVRDDGWHQEWIQIQLNRIWIHYWQIRLPEMNALVEQVGPLVETRGSALQRSNYYLALVLRNERQDRYVMTETTLEFMRRSLEAALEAQAPQEIAFARFCYGFVLLFADRLAHAESELHEALQGTRRSGDITAELRSLAYLGLTFRKAGRVEEARRAAQETLALAGTTGMKDYLGLAQAGLGWAALKEKRLAEARQWSRAALDTWSQLGFAYPFQWSGGLNLLAAGLEEEPLAALVDQAGKLLEPEQMCLPDAIRKALEAAVAAFGQGQAAGARKGLRDAIRASLELGYL